MKHLYRKSRPPARRLRTAFALLLLLSVYSGARAQFSLLGGPGITNVRSKIELEGQKAQIGLNGGISLQLYPFKKAERLSAVIGWEFAEKGYWQNLGRTYKFRFYYMSFPLTASYDLSNSFSVQSGLELSGLAFTNLRRGIKTYNNFDMGLIAGATAFNDKPLSLYTRLTYGLVPLLDYYQFDEMGNFVGEIRDLKNISFSIGFKINLHNEKIRLYKSED